MKISSNESLLPNPWPSCHYIGEEEIQKVVKVLQCKSPSRFMGPDIQGFACLLEEWYCSYLGRKYAIAVNSGTSALSLSLSSLDIGPGDEVLVPSYAWSACYSSIIRSGAIPRIVEIDESLSMDPEDLNKKISRHSRAVLLVHMSGSGGDIQRILNICKKHGLYLIEDVSQANGGKFNSRPLGSFGDVAIFSFQMNKTITAGEGGLIACDDENLWQRAWIVHDDGYWHKSSKAPDCFDNLETSWGVGARVNELTAAMLFAQTKKLDEIVHAMQIRQQMLCEGLKGLPGIRFRSCIEKENDIGSFLVLVWPNKFYCEEIVRRTREAGVCTESGFGNLTMSEMGLHLYYNNLSLINKIPTHYSGRPWNDPLNKFAKDYEYVKGTMPVSDNLFDCTQLLTVSPALTEDSISKIIRVFWETVVL